MMMLSTINLLLSASEGARGTDTLRTFAAVIVVVMIALLLTTRLAKRIQRARPIAALMSSGWLAIGVGFLLGPNALSAVDPETLLDVRPLLVIGLGWIGMIVGLQAHRQVLAQTPAAMWRWVLADVVLSLGIGIAAALLFLLPRLDGDHLGAGWLVLPFALLGCATIGWAPETRSLQDQRGEAATNMVRAIRGVSGLASLIAVTIYGVAAAFVVRDEDGSQQIILLAGFLTLASASLLALLAGAGSRSLLALSHRDRSQTLVIFLGTVTLVAGIATELQFSPLFAAMLVGIVISNLAGTHLRSFEWFILRAEHAVANIFFLLAGVLIEPAVGLWGWGIIIVLVVARLLFKSLLLRRALSPSREVLSSGSTLVHAPVRQSPIAIAIAVGLVLAESSHMNVRLLTVVVMVGLISELLPTGMSMLARRRIAEPQEQTPEESTATTGEAHA